VLWRSCSSGRTINSQPQRLPSAREIFVDFDVGSRDEEKEKEGNRKEEDDEETGGIINREVSDLTTTDDESSNMPRVISDVVLAPEELPSEPEYSPGDLAPLSDADITPPTRSISYDPRLDQHHPHHHHHHHHHRPHRHHSDDESHHHRNPHYHLHPNQKQKEW